MSKRRTLGAIFALLVAGGIATGAHTAGQPVRFDTLSSIHPAGPSAQWGVPSAIVFDDSSVQSLDLTLEDEDWAFLNANPVLERFVPTSLSYRGRTHTGVAVRYKGYYGALRFCFTPAGVKTCKKLSLKLKFNEYDPAGRFYGLRRLNLHAMERDTTRMHEMLGYELFRQAGVPAPRTAYVRLTVNGESLGLYLAVEEIDEEFIRRSFPDAGKGTLFKDAWPIDDDAARYAAAVEAGRPEGAEGMARFAAALEEAGEADFESTLRAWTDFETLMNYLAVDRLIENFDGIVGWYCLNGPCYNHNYYWYKDAFSDRVWLIPWDLDSAFTYPAPIRTFYRMPDWDAPPNCATIPVFLGIPGRPPSCDTIIHRLATVTWEDYAAATRNLLADQFDLDRLQARVDELSALIAPIIAEDSLGPSTAVWTAAVAKLRVDVAAMRSSVEQKVRPR